MLQTAIKSVEFMAATFLRLNQNEIRHTVITFIFILNEKLHPKLPVLK